MAWLSDLLQGIPLNAVLKERIAYEEKRFKDLETENKRLKEQVSALTEENDGLKKMIEQVPVAVAPPKELPEIMYSSYYFNGDNTKLYCAGCYDSLGKKHLMARMPGMGFKCTVCKNFIHGPG